MRPELGRGILSYLGPARIRGDATAQSLTDGRCGRQKQLAANSLSRKTFCQMVKRRLKAAKLREGLLPRSFQVTAITDLVTQSVPLENVH